MAPSNPTMKRLFALSGNACSFPGCMEPLTDTSADGSAVSLGDIAHIVAKSRQGPRGRSPLSDRERDEADNLLVLCLKHHRVIDADPRTYTPAVLAKIKADHELRHLPPQVPSLRPMVFENVSATYLPVRQLPATVFSADSTARDFAGVVGGLRRLRGSAPVSPFLLRDGRLWAFADLAEPSGPFSRVIDAETIRAHAAQELWGDPDGYRRYIALLNKGLTLWLTRHFELVWDNEHRRYFFPKKDTILEGVRLKTKTGRNQTRAVVLHRPNRRTGGTLDWLHEAVQLRFERFADASWGLSILPAFHLTSDGETPLAPKLVGPRVTRKKGGMFNEQYFDRINFWREYLTEGTPRFILRFGRQAVVADRGFPVAEVEWPAIHDRRFDPADGPDETLLTHLDLSQASDGDFVWDDVSDLDDHDMEVTA